MSTGILVLNFGEPDEATLEKVRPYLERIFLQNASLEGHADDAAVARARQLATDRAPGLVADYAAIGGSPLNAQADAQAHALETELRSRGRDVRVYSAFQFTEPSIDAKVSEARDDGVDSLVALPVYPLCGHSTTAAALRDVRAAVDAIGWAPGFVGVAGWHHHPAYRSMLVEHLRAFVSSRGLDLGDPDTLLYFSVHGTPVRYLSDGNRYDRYVYEHCRDIAHVLHTDRYQVGFQNHANRRIRWTQPDNEDAIRGRPERRLVVVPISFMHEQSETLAELDHELVDFVSGLGKEMHRVPVPHDDPRFVRFLADLVSEVTADDPAQPGLLSPCRCCPTENTWCTNGSRELPPSPYVTVDEPPEHPAGR
ncbi:MAG: ferrochelatase [Gemmatimonadetes bacterium]|nr:ferrochelatase [Gemmatimonadota bacterium]